MAVYGLMEFRDIFPKGSAGRDLMKEFHFMVGLLILVHQAPSDPYYAQTLQAWENGRFVRFHGLSRWFGLLWPFVALSPNTSP